MVSSRSGNFPSHPFLFVSTPSVCPEGAACHIGWLTVDSYVDICPPSVITNFTIIMFLSLPVSKDPRKRNVPKTRLIGEREKTEGQCSRLAQLNPEVGSPQ